MSDLFKGQSMSEAYKFISAGTAHTFTFNFQPDKVVFNNLTDWAGTANNLPVSVWFRGQTDAAEAYQQQVIDSAAASSFNFLNPQTNGFTVADTAGGQASAHKTITAVSQADPCVVTIASHGLQSDQIIRITDLGNIGPNVTARGMNELNNNRYKIVVIDANSFSLKDPVTGEAIDSSGYVAYVSGGFATLESHVISLNNPQVDPYSNSNPYNPNPYLYSPVDYKLTAGTDVMGANSDVFLIEVYKFGAVYDLGDLLV